MVADIIIQYNGKILAIGELKHADPKSGQNQGEAQLLATILRCMADARSEQPYPVSTRPKEQRCPIGTNNIVQI